MGGNQGNKWRGNLNQNQGQYQPGNQGFGGNQNQGSSNSSQDVDMANIMNQLLTQREGTQGSNQASTSSGRLLASTENPRNQVNVITTNSRKALKDLPFPSNDPVPERNDERDDGQEEVEVEIESDKEEEPLIQRDKSKGKAPMLEESAPGKKRVNKGKEIDDSVIPCNLLLFPQRLWKSKESERENKFHKMLDKLEISIPFVEAVTQIPSYKQFLKNILSNKKKPEKSVKLPPKLKDPGSFAIPCIIGGFLVGGALCDLGASVSLMPYSLCKRLNLGEPKPTTMTIQMANRSIKCPVGVLEDIPVMIDQYFISGNFVVFDIEEDANVPIILGRPFLVTAGAIIDVKRGKLVMEVAEKKIEFDIFKIANHQPSYVDGVT
ncbi:uncharacterized protein LOC116001139 [Ipomoea triloba]|uniref:uncharacterized protein LOC116001139 n=1 Tax=Ipomoea triloba TaxID=35885 RepID=UPI00125E78B6|nr:uncharacterized protein LOC116001139 [Ipomoea triloba]